MQDRYVSPNLPYPDAIVAAVLCVGGPCKYKLVDGSGITRAWLRQYVVANMIAKPGISNDVADVLSLPLLWAALEPSMDGKMPTAKRASIRQAYFATRTLAAGVNPVRKRLLIVSGYEDDLRIDECIAGDASGGPPGAGGGAAAAGIDPNVGIDGRALYARFNALERQLIQAEEQRNRTEERLTAALDRTNKNVRRIATQPVVRARQQAANPPGVNGGQAVFVASTLSPLSRNLHNVVARVYTWNWRKKGNPIIYISRTWKKQVQVP